MVTSPCEWKILEWDENLETKIFDGRFQGSQIPLGYDFMGLSRQQNCRSWDPDKDRKEMVSKNISWPSREYAILTRHHWKHEHRATGSGNATFPAVVKSVSSREAHHGPGRSAPHTERKVNRSWKTGGLYEVGSSKAIGTDGRAPRGENYSIRHARECQAYIKQYFIICKSTALPVEKKVFYVVPKR